MRLFPRVLKLVTERHRLVKEIAEEAERLIAKTQHQNKLAMMLKRRTAQLQGRKRGARDSNVFVQVPPFHTCFSQREGRRPTSGGHRNERHDGSDPGSRCAELVSRLCDTAHTIEEACARTRKAQLRLAKVEKQIARIIR